MAKRDSEGAPKKPYSSKLMQMKFMQRGSQSAKAAVPEKSEEKRDDYEWVADRDAQKGCLVVFEGDPAPASSSGRISFSGLAEEGPPTELQPNVKTETAPAALEPQKADTVQPSPKKRKKASAIRGERFDSPQVDTKGRYFVS